MTPSMLTRREAIARVALLFGGTLVGGDAILRGAVFNVASPRLALHDTEIGLLDEIGETIIPATDTPGAKSVGIGAFMEMMARTCYDEPNHAAFKAGISTVGARAARDFGCPFAKATPEQRTGLLNRIAAEAGEYERCREEEQPAHYFTMMRQLAILGYFTSEVGASQVLRYLETPGRYDGNAPYKKGERAWFVNPSRRL